MKSRPGALAIATTCSALIAGSAGAISQISWADSQHGWKSGYDPERDQGIVLSTENGGRTWHRIATGFDVHGLVRTSVSAGLVDESHGVIWWTRDNGKHWYQAPERMINGEFLGSARFLFWVREDLQRLFQVRPWPPRGAVPRACRHIRICFRYVRAGARAVPVAEVSDGHFLSLANVPGGILAVVGSTDPRSFRARVFLRLSGSNRMIELPTINGVRPCSGFGQGPIVDWPEITVLGCVGTTGAETAAWISEDGGTSWTTYRR